jgi:hypothetical protein
MRQDSFFGLFQCSDDPTPPYFPGTGIVAPRDM